MIHNYTVKVSFISITLRLKVRHTSVIRNNKSIHSFLKLNASTFSNFSLLIEGMKKLSNSYHYVLQIFNSGDVLLLLNTKFKKRPFRKNIFLFPCSTIYYYTIGQKQYSNDTFYSIRILIFYMNLNFYHPFKHV